MTEKKRFEMVDFDDALSLDLADEEEREYLRYQYFVIEHLPNGEVRLIGQDGGEPEDQRLFRDWKWVVPALNDAFKNGVQEGLRQEVTR